MKWFGTVEPIATMRVSLGLERMKIVLRELRCDSFLPLTTAVAESLGCRLDDSPGMVAAVCQPSRLHKVMLSHEFLDVPLHRSNGVNQPSILVHELAHLQDVFATRGRGEVYTFFAAQRLALSSPEQALNNSDNISGYVTDAHLS